MSKFVYTDGAFIGEDADIRELFTPAEAIVSCVDEEFVQDGKYVSSTKDDGFLGDWTYDLEKGSNILYIVSNGDIHEFVIFDQHTANGPITYYITDINGYIHNCQPEEGDVIYSTYKEARLEVLASDLEQQQEVDNTKEIVQVYSNDPYLPGSSVEQEMLPDGECDDIRWIKHWYRD